MEKLFLAVLNLSLAGSYAILAVLVGRLLLAKAPKKWSYVLWAVVAFRLAFPVSFSSRFSLWNITALRSQGSRVEYIPADIGYQAHPQVNLGNAALSQAVSGSLPAAAPMASMNPMQFWLFLGSRLWVAGMAALLGYSLISLLLLKRSLCNARCEGENIWVSEAVSGPFVVGWFHPRIYLPEEMEPQVRRLVLAHERCHLRRGDHWIKLGAFLLLTVHWFNPLCWLAFRLMARDMEMSCDEDVLARDGIRPKEYSFTLLGLASGRAVPLSSPLHFGESDIKGRIRNILKWKKPGRVITALAAAAVLAFTLTVAANPEQRPSRQPNLGTYPMETDMAFGPVLSLEQEGRFTYYYSLALSSFPGGNYQVNDSVLTCEAEDGRFTLKFRVIDENTLEYLEDGSLHPTPMLPEVEAVPEEGDRFLRTDAEPEEAAPEVQLQTEEEAQPELLGNPLAACSYVSRKVSEEYGHLGTDFCAPQSTPVYAIADGTVTVAEYHQSYGNYVRLAHTQPYEGQEVESLYAHMETLAVEEGETVGRGDLLGYVGASGNATGNNLHLELRLDGQPVEPTGYLDLPIEPDDGQYSWHSRQ